MRSKNEMRQDFADFLRQCGDHPEDTPQFALQEGEGPLFEAIVDGMLDRLGDRANDDLPAGVTAADVEHYGSQERPDWEDVGR